MVDAIDGLKSKVNSFIRSTVRQITDSLLAKLDPAAWVDIFKEKVNAEISKPYCLPPSCEADEEGFLARTVDLYGAEGEDVHISGTSRTKVCMWLSAIQLTIDTDKIKSELNKFVDNIGLEDMVQAQIEDTFGPILTYYETLNGAVDSMMGRRKLNEHGEESARRRALIEIADHEITHNGDRIFARVHDAVIENAKPALSTHMDAFFIQHRRRAAEDTARSIDDAARRSMTDVLPSGVFDFDATANVEITQEFTLDLKASKSRAVSIDLLDHFNVPSPPPVSTSGPLHPTMGLVMYNAMMSMDLSMTADMLIEGAAEATLGVKTILNWDSKTKRVRPTIQRKILAGATSNVHFGVTSKVHGFAEASLCFGGVLACAGIRVNAGWEAAAGADAQVYIGNTGSPSNLDTYYTDYAEYPNMNSPASCGSNGACASLQAGFWGYISKPSVVVSAFYSYSAVCSAEEETELYSLSVSGPVSYSSLSLAPNGAADHPYGLLFRFGKYWSIKHDCNSRGLSSDWTHWWAPIKVC
jgi:hypothetical protein